MQPLIGVTGRQTAGFNLNNAPSILMDAPVDLHWAEYCQKLAAADALPVQLPMAVDPEAVVQRLDGLVLTGGTDVTPQRYGSGPTEQLWAVEPDRDEFELAVLAAAIDRGIPVLGICRGIQIINVHFGGTLHPHHAPDQGEGHSSMAYPRNIGRHEITLEPGSALADLYGSSAMVNSFHHQSVAEVGDGLKVVARAADGVVEAVEHSSRPVTGIQWHPEMMRIQEPVWDWFVKSCG